jgi:hypothetical protein
MTATFTTTITGLITAAQQGTLTDVVTAVNWMVVAKDGNKFARKGGSTPVGPADAAKFTAFPNLTLQQVLAWIPDPATPEVQAALTAQIAAQVPPSIVTKMPPWTTVRPAAPAAASATTTTATAKA